MIAIAISGIAAGYGIGTTTPTSSQRITTTTTVTSAPSSSSAPYVVTLVITNGNLFNSTVGDQPAYYVLGSNGLQSSAQISLPANQLIKLVIVDYDSGAASLIEPKYVNVTGVLDNSIAVVNDSVVNSTQGQSGIQIGGVENLTSLPADVISHTFTIPSLGINIPVAGLSTEVAYFTIKTAGTYLWFCMTECGSGANGLGGAMSAPGWMSGSVVAR